MTHSRGITGVEVEVPSRDSIKVKCVRVEETEKEMLIGPRPSTPSPSSPHLLVCCHDCPE